MSKIRETIISNCEKKFVLKNLGEWNRLDGRAFDEFRELKIHFGADWGCCHVSLGRTKVIAQVSCEIQEPKISRPSEGLLNVNLELSPMGAPHFEAGRQTDMSIQLNRLLEKCLKDSKAVDLESLCIKVKEKVWAFRVDINVLNHEGNILDCASVAALAALAHFRRPDVTTDGEEITVHSYSQRDPIPTVMHHYPVCITFSIFNVGEILVADPTLLEEGVADAHITFAINSYKELCTLHLGGNSHLTMDVILRTTNKAAARAKNVIQQIKNSIEKDSVIRAERKQVGFHLNLISSEEETAIQDLNRYLDQWSVKKSSRKKQNWKKHKGDEIKSNEEGIINENEIEIKNEEFDVEDNTDEGKNTEKCQNVNRTTDRSTEKSNASGNKGIKENINKIQEANIQQLGKGSALFLPKETNKSIWIESSEDEIEIIDVKSEETKKVPDIKYVEDSSEEESVIILNADQQTNKRKRKL